MRARFGAAEAGSPLAPRGARPLALEGAFESLGRGLGESYLGAFALYLGAGGLALGLVATLPTGAVALAQVLARPLRDLARRTRRLIATTWLLQALAYAVLGGCVFLPPRWSVPALCVGALLAWGLGGLAVPAWTGMVFSLLTKPQHGWFFGLRGQAQQTGVLIAILGGSAILSVMTENDYEGLGFALVFLAAGIARAGGTGLLALVPDPAHPRPPRHHGPWLEALRDSAKVRRLSFYLWGLHFGSHIATPFFVPYMLEDLEYSYGLVGLLIAVPPLGKIASARLWGVVADRRGPGPLLRAMGWVVTAIPALWLLAPNLWWILAIQVLSGISWGAVELAQASALLQTTRGREHAVGLFNMIDGGMIILGSLAGGLVVNAATTASATGYRTAMLVSTCFRALPAIILLWRVRGIGRPSWSHLRLPMRLWAIRPTRGISYRPLEEAAEGELDEPT
jgi:MFS family permease